ncbi:MAG: hypothetical protein HKN64_04430 [Woeseiaceae bacterium]|nr:hypothetical protein [Woeseiaceae bacterium]
MEVLLQYLDDIDDMVGAFGLLLERFRSAFLTVLTLLGAAAAVASGVLLALVHQRAALATCALLLAALLYRQITAPHAGQTRVA